MAALSHADRVAWVTGAGSGIGRQIAHQLAIEQGARVLVIDRDAQGANDTVLAIRAAGGQAQSLVMDLADTGALERALSPLDDVHGPVDILVNNAAVAATIPATTPQLAHWEATFAVNLTAPMLLSQQALRSMQRRGWGRIVNIASISGVRAGSGRLAYGTSKAALIAMTRQFAIEAAESGVTVNAIAPGPIDTPLVQRMQGGATRAATAEIVPMRRFGEPRDIADAVLFLCSDRAGYITGHTLAVDGGFLASGVLMRQLSEPPPAAAS